MKTKKQILNKIKQLQKLPKEEDMAGDGYIYIAAFRGPQVAALKWVLK